MILDRFLVALGFQVEAGGLKQFEQQAERAKETVLGLGTALKALVAGFAVREIAKIGDEFEQNTIAIAGFFDALGISKAGDFDNAMSMASETMDQIVKSAALLPGEAEEYIEVFRAGLPTIREAKPDWKTSDITEFTNKLAAIAHTLKLPAEVTSREMQELFVSGEGHATRVNLLFKRFLPTLHQVEGQSKLTAKSFNAMTQQQRVELFQKSFAKMQPMLDRAAHSFDAMWGAFVSGIKQVVRYGTKGLFEGMKEGLDAVNGALFNADGTMTEFAQSVVNAFTRVGHWIGNGVRFFTALIVAVGKFPGVATAAKVAVTLLGVALAGLAVEKTVGKVGLLIKGLLNLKNLLMGGVFLAIFLVAEDLYVFAKGGKSVTGVLVEMVKKSPLAKTVLSALGAVVLTVGAAFVAAKAAALASMVRMGVGLVMLNAPLLLVVGTVALLAGGIYYVVTRWKTFGPAAKTAVVMVTTVLGVLAAAFVGMKAAAIAAGVQAWVAGLKAAAGWVVALGPIGLVILALVAVGVAIYEVSKHWDQVVQFIKDHPLLSGVMAVMQPLLAVIVGIVAIGKNWDTVVDQMGRGWDDLIDRLKDAWNEFAGLINKAGVITLPTFERPQMLPAGEGVLQPDDAQIKGPWEGGYTTGGGAEGPTYDPEALAASSLFKRGTRFGEGGRSLAPVGDVAQERNRVLADAARAWAAAHAPAPRAVGPEQQPAYASPSYVDAARAGTGAGNSSPTVNHVTNNYVTRIDSPKIEIKGSGNDQATARAVEQHLNKIARRGTRSAGSKSVL